MKNYDKSDLFFLVLIAGILLFGCFGIYMSVTQTTEFVAKCHAAEGVPIRAKYSLVCLSPDAVKDVGE